MVAAKNSEASATPASDDLPLFDDRYQAHNPDAGRNESREVLVNAATPQSIPNAIHGITPARSSISIVSQKITASSSAARLVSHTARVHQNMAKGSSAHIQEVQTATFSLKHRLAMRKIGMQVSAEQRLLKVRRISAEAWL